MESFTPPSKSIIYRMIKDCGASKTLLKRVLPQWWDDNLLSSNAGLLQFSLLLRNRLGIQMEVDKSGFVSFRASSMPIQFKKRANTDYEKLADAALLTQAVGKTIIRVLRYNDALQNTESFFSELAGTNSVDLANVVGLLWKHNIPVLYLENFPAALSRPAGTIVRDEDYYAIVLSHKHKSVSTQLFVLLHEIGHMKLGHLKTSGLITDVSISALGETLKEDTDQQEIEADEFALNMLRNGVDLRGLLRNLGPIERPGELALHATKLSNSHNVNPGHFVLTFGRETRNWILAHQALKFLERDTAQAVFKASYENVKSRYDIKTDDLELLDRLQ